MGVGRAIFHVFESAGVEEMIISITFSTNFLRLARPKSKIVYIRHQKGVEYSSPCQIIGVAREGTAARVNRLTGRLLPQYAFMGSLCIQNANFSGAQHYSAPPDPRR